MFDVGWSELLVIGVVALIVIPPKDLPGAFRSAGRAIGKLRQMAGDFRTQFDDAMREADIHEVKKTFTDLQTSASEAAAPLNTIREEIGDTVRNATGAGDFSAHLREIEADAKALEAEIDSQTGANSIAPPEPVVIVPEPVAEPAVEAAAEPAPKPRRKKAAADGDAA